MKNASFRLFYLNIIIFLVLFAPSAHANIVWVGLDLSSIYSLFAIPFSIVLEAVVLYHYKKVKPTKALVQTTFANLFSMLCGYPLMVIGTAVVTFFVQAAFFFLSRVLDHYLQCVTSAIVVASISTFIELGWLRKIHGHQFERDFKIRYFAINLFTAALAVSLILFHKEIWFWNNVDNFIRRVFE